MPRTKRGLDEIDKACHPGLTAELVQELRGGKNWGQPRIEETEFPTKLLRVTVFWDKWERIRDDERAVVIQQAYEEVEGRDYRDRIALPIGLTFPEAHELGLLRCSLEPRVRPNDPVKLEQCYQAMRDLGASELFGRGRPELWFVSRKEMESYLSRLEQLVPGSENNWVSIEEIGSRDL